MSRFPRNLLLAVACAASVAHAANEAALLELWQHHAAKPDDHETAIKECRAFAAANANEPLLPIVNELESWHHLRAGHDAEALRLLESYAAAPAGPLTDGARRVALGWLTRFDREKVAAALQVYYKKEIAYPKSLDQLSTLPKLPAAARPPLTDRFGKPWVYQLTGFSKLPGFTDQKYSLQSAALGDLSELKKTLALPYASRLSATPAQVLAAADGSQAVRFNIPGKSGIVISLGQAAGDLHVAFVGAQIIAVCDFTHWTIYPRP